MARITCTSMGNDSPLSSEYASTQSATFGPTPGNSNSSRFASSYVALLRLQSHGPFSATIRATCTRCGAR